MLPSNIANEARMLPIILPYYPSQSSQLKAFEKRAGDNYSWKYRHCTMGEIRAANIGRQSIYLAQWVFHKKGKRTFSNIICYKINFMPEPDPKAIPS